MLAIPTMLAGLALAGVVFVIAVIAGREGGTLSHTLAFFAGLAGLVALPAWLCLFAAVAVEALFAPAVPGAVALFVGVSLALVVALSIAIATLFALRGRMLP